MKEELPALLSAVSDLYQKSQVELPLNVSDIESTPDRVFSNGAASYNAAPGGINGHTSGGTPTSTIGTTTTIAARLKVESGPELVLAAAARLTMAEGHSVFTRKQLINEMRSAHSYFKETYVKNLSGSVHRLLKDNKLNEPSKGNLALTASCRAELEARLAGQ
ncbi:MULTISPECIES: hypothetical protein [Paraburkholderia]|uniref:Uncharacterized protein n=1 Tax=Paraburkholderia unamae TaxID=219649 RepID=A0ACC6RHV2_9BURK